MTGKNPLKIGDIVSRTGNDRYRVVSLYEDCDEVVLEGIGPDGTGDGCPFDLCWFDCELIERPFDQFTRWLCPKCGAPGIDSWNKAMFDGLDHGDDPLPNPHVLGDNCQDCVWPITVCYTAPDKAPTAIVGPIGEGRGCFRYEPESMDKLMANPAAGETLQPSDQRDRDWSRGGLAAREQLQ